MLNVEQICKTFNVGTVNEKIALAGVSFRLNEGDFVTVVGGNGSGKTTMLNAVAGVFPVDSGQIRIQGENVTHLPEHKRAAYIGRVFQDPMIGSASNMTIEENLALSYRRGQRRGLGWGIGRQERKGYMEALRQLDLGLENRMSTKVGLLSGGQRQALTLLMATIKRPKLLLLDEHTAALDPKTAIKVLELSSRFILQDGLTALMVTHNMNDAINYGNRMIVMEEGQIVHEAQGEDKLRLTVTDVVSLMNRFMALG
jgi:putative ABC transport system ATP-binding protein